LTSEQRATLQSWLAAGKTEQRLVVPDADLSGLPRAEQQGDGGPAGDAPATVSKWRGRFARRAWPGWRMRAQRQAAALPDQRCAADHRALDASPPAGYARWNGTLWPSILGDISSIRSGGCCAEREISLERRRSWCISTDPAFAQKAADIVALYLQPPENGVVLSVDESRTSRPWSVPRLVELPNGKALTGFNHEYNVMARRPCSPLWRWPPAWSKPAITGAAGASSSCTS